MIVKMKFLSITGPKDDIERMARQYLSKYEIQLENALTELRTVKDLRPYAEKNPYEDLLRRSREYLPENGLPAETKAGLMSIQQAEETINSIGSTIESLRTQKVKLIEDLNKCRTSMEYIEPFRLLHYDMHRLISFNFIRYRFGRIPKEYFEKFKRYVYDTLDTIFYQCRVDDDYVWGVYFAPVSLTHRIDAVYASMHFEHIFLPDEYEGTADEAYASLKLRIQELDAEIKKTDEQIASALSDRMSDLESAVQTVEELASSFNLRKYAALTKERNNVYYILCGWMPEKQADKFQREIEDDSQTFVVVEDDHDNIFSTPPTKLKNLKIFKPFEMYIRMYGLPAYNEIDPTSFVALTYALIFGAMFGDVGQGLCLAIGGFFLYKFKKMNLAAIIGIAGIFSTFFGFMFGSFFGFEDTVIHTVWLMPKEAMTQIPGIGNLNTVFVVAIAFGMFLILTSMIFHIINGFKAKDIENIWFDTNGVAGLVFYASIVITVVLFMTGHTTPGGVILFVMFGLPLILIALKEPITHLILKKSELIPGGKVMFLVQTFFEIFEVLMSYFSNTLSFVRIGAFAVSHAAMMEVVLMLAGFENGGNGNWLVIIIGNLFVCGLEGLIVGIQVLRLEYYEMFSRFYKGTGNEFRPYGIAKK